MNVGIVGLGLIGGSMAKAYKKSGYTVFAYDNNENILEFAKLEKIVDYTLETENIKKCDLIIIALYPQATIDFLQKNADFINKTSIVIDCCGTKRLVCKACFEIAKKYGFTFVGGHPMAGTHNSGYKFSKEDMFKNAPMVIVPDKFDDIYLIEKIKNSLKPAGFGRFVVTNADEHDKMIAFTSQMAHLVSNAFIKSPTAKEHNGVSAGSYKDLTRVAWLNPDMWTELFFENKDFLVNELDILIDNLNKYKNALNNDKRYEMKSLLDEGRKIKEEVDGK